MAITVNHQFVSAKGDGSDATLVRPSNWNESHNIKLATNKVIGRLTAGPGDAEELPVTSFMMGLLNTADFAALAIALGLPTTGDAKLTFKVVVDAGWVFANDGSIGDALSGATTLAHNTATTALFTFFYNTFSDAIAPVQISTGAATTRAAQGSAATAFSAHCRMVLPRTLGRALIVAGTGAGLTARALGTFGGEEYHQMTLAELAGHAHSQQGTFAGSGSGSGSISGSGSGSCSGTTNGSDRSLDHAHSLGGFTGNMDRANPHTHGVGGSSATGTTVAGVQGGGTYAGVITAGGSISILNADIDHLHRLPATTGLMDRSIDHLHTFNGSASVSVSGSCSVSVNVNTTISGVTSSVGTNAPFNVMQPWTAWNVMIKL